MQRGLILIVCCLMAHAVAAQDIHFSQYRMAPLLLNPAQAGFSYSKARFSANHRSQWRAVTVPFNTFSVAGDFKLYQDRRAANIIGSGVYAWYDRAGDSRFGTTSAGTTLSYHRALNDYGNHYLGLGAAFSYNDRSYDYSALVFGNQYNGKKFDQDLPNGETFLNQGFIFYDLNVGVHWFYRPEPDLAFDAGAVLSHVNRPPQSMLNDGNIRLDRKFSFYLNAEVLSPNKRTWSPGLFFFRQGTYTEVLAGTMVSLEQFNGGYHLSNFQAGLFLRPVDAAIFIFHFDYHDVTFGLSYDINYSGLRAASTFRGGFEASLRYMIQKKKRKRPGSIPCPDPF
jgi:type IX secretion system PorP/SprF family membrane protein